MAWDFSNRLQVVVIHLIDGFFPDGRLRDHAADPRRQRAQPFAANGVVGDNLGDDIAGAGERVLPGRHALLRVDKRRGERLRAAVPELLSQQDRRQRLEAFLPRDGRPRPPLRAVGPVNVLDLRERGRAVQRVRHFLRQFFLRRDTLADLLPALVQVPEISQTVVELAQHLVVAGAGHLLAVAGNERDRASLVDESDDVFDVLGFELKFL